MFKYEKIETKDLILKPLELKDYKGLHKNFLTDKVSAGTMLWKPSKTLKDSRVSVEDFFNRIKNGDLLSYSIIEKNSNEIIGRINLTLQKNDESIIKSIGMGLGQKFTGKGYGTQVLESIIKFCFNDLNIKKIHTAFFPRNIASKKLQEKLGFVEDGSLFELERKNTGEIEKVQPMILTKEIWENSKIITKESECKI